MKGNMNNNIFKPPADPAYTDEMRAADLARLFAEFSAIADGFVEFRMVEDEGQTEEFAYISEAEAAEAVSAEAVAASIGQVNQGLTKVEIEEDSESEDEEDNDFFISESDMPALSAESIGIGVNYLGKLATIIEEDSEGSDSEEEEEPEDNSLRLSAVD